jgi:glutaredoxin-like protein NrdH
MIKKFLTEHNVPFVEHNVDEEPHYITHIKDELGFMAVPVIECDGVAFQGFNPTELRKLESVSV